MNGFCYQFFPGTAFSAYKNRSCWFGHLGDHFCNWGNRGTEIDNWKKFFFLPKGISQSYIFLGKLLPFHGLVNCYKYPFFTEGLGYIVKSAFSGCLYSGFNSGICCHNYHNSRGLNIFYRIKDCHPIHLRHFQISYYDIKLLFSQ